MPFFNADASCADAADPQVINAATAARTSPRFRHAGLPPSVLAI
jgi:hypothetical protein